ncbi:MAG: hypothetical protein HY903_09385 [Deltaproteobacteria bacterium]|nr:hypothetical protein [Deltaproteobacteria bacterium]
MWQPPACARRLHGWPWLAALLAAAFACVLETPTLEAVGDADTGPATDGTLPADAEATMLAVDLQVDANRDGVIDAADDDDEETWTPERGATFIANLDDDDDDRRPDAEDDRVNGDADLLDLAPVLVYRPAGLSPGQVLELRLTPATAPLRLFQERDAAWVCVRRPNEGVVTIEDPGPDVPALRLRLEAQDTRSPAWDGVVAVELRVRAGATIVGADQVALRGSPIIFPDNRQPLRALYVMQVATGAGANGPFYDAVRTNLPADAALFTVAGPDYGYDRWLQDAMQPGYQLFAGVGGARTLTTYLKVERPRGGLEHLLANDVLGPDHGYVYPCLTALCPDSSLNYGGNIEVVPPHSTGARSFPLGRLLVGGTGSGTLFGHPSPHAAMATAERDWLEAQGAQTPLLELSVGWLAVGHVDEVSLFVGDRSATAPHAFKVVLASPARAIGILRDLADRGLTSVPLFAGRVTETTVGEILSDSDLLTFNDLAQARIDTLRETLQTEVGLTADELLEVPALFEPYLDGADLTELAVAYSPALTNLVPMGDVLLVADPEGPHADGVDLFAAAASAALAPLRASVVYVDIFDSYHLGMGGAHCGVNLENAPYPAVWWQP